MVAQQTRTDYIESVVEAWILMLEMAHSMVMCAFLLPVSADVFLAVLQVMGRLKKQYLLRWGILSQF